MRAAIFIEPDGILALPRGPSSMRPWLSYDVQDGAHESLLLLKSSGFLLVAASNESRLLQTGATRAELDRMHDSLREAFALDDYLACRHDHADFCPCRKPHPGLFTEAAYKWHLDLDNSFVIGNRWQDAEAARMAGCVSLLVRSPWIGSGHHDYVMPDLPSIAGKILELKAFAPGAPPHKWLAACGR